MSNMCIDAAVSEIEAAGFRPTVDHTGKHPSISWDQLGKTVTYVVSATPSDFRAPLNVRTDIRQMIRARQDALPEPVIDIRAVGTAAMVNSRHVAETFGKEHKNVLRDIDNLLKSLDCSELSTPPFALVMLADGGGIDRRSYDMTRDGFSLLAMGFTGARALKFKVAFINAFNAMEATLSRGASALPSYEAERIAQLEGDVAALTDLFLSEPRTKVKKAPFVRPSVARALRRAAGVR